MEATWRCEFNGTDSSESYNLLITRHQKGVTRKLRFYSEFPFSAHFLSKTLTGTVLSAFFCRHTCTEHTFSDSLPGKRLLTRCCLPTPIIYSLQINLLSVIVVTLLKNEVTFIKPTSLIIVQGRFSLSGMLTHGMLLPPTANPNARNQHADSPATEQLAYPMRNSSSSRNFYCIFP